MPPPCQAIAPRAPGRPDPPGDPGRGREAVRRARLRRHLHQGHRRGGGRRRADHLLVGRLEGGAAADRRGHHGRAGRGQGAVGPHPGHGRPAADGALRRADRARLRGRRARRPACGRRSRRQRPPSPRSPRCWPRGCAATGPARGAWSCTSASTATCAPGCPPTAAAPSSPSVTHPARVALAVRRARLDAGRGRGLDDRDAGGPAAGGRLTPGHSPRLTPRPAAIR